MAKEHSIEKNPVSMKIAIVGGGFMGLVLAHKISKENASVTVFERDKQLGGLATHHDYEDFIWDKFYHVVLPTDANLIALIQELGLEEQLIWNRSLTGYYVGNKFYSISSMKEFLLFPPLGILDKIRLGYTIFRGSKVKNWKKLEKISVKDWLIRMGGKNTFKKFWEPLLLAKLGENYEKVSAVFIWTYIKRLFDARESAAKKEHMGYISGSYKTVFDRIAQQLEANNSEVIVNTTVKSIRPDPAGGVQLAYDDQITHFDKVICTAPVNVLRKITSPDLVAISNDQQGIEYLGVICMVLITEKPLTPYYVLNIADDQIPFTGVIGMSSLVDLQETKGKHITYFPKYVTPNHTLWSLPEEELERLFLKGVKKLYPEFDMDNLRSAHINKAVKVQPLQVLNYSEIVPTIKTNHQDFFVLNTSQFVNDTLNNNSVVKHIDTFMTNFGKELQKDTNTNKPIRHG